jgi:hypothetical protein
VKEQLRQNGSFALAKAGAQGRRSDLGTLDSRFRGEPEIRHVKAGASLRAKRSNLDPGSHRRIEIASSLRSSQ